MGLVRHRGVLRDSAGNGVNTATVTVTVSASGAAASLYTDKDGVYPTVGNVVLTDEVGRFWFYLAEGTYDLTYTKAGVALGSDVDVPVVDPMLFEEVSLKKFNLQSSGNNTTAIQAALDAAAADKLCLVVPPGTWEATQLIIPGNLRWRGAEPSGCVIKQRASTNDHFVTVAYGCVQNPIIENLTIDGNRLNNSAGDALHIEDHAEPDATVTYGFSVVLRNSYVQNAAGLCMYIGVNRNMGHVENTEFKRGAIGLVSWIESSDWRFASSRFGFPISGSALIGGNGADNVAEACSFYGAIDAPCVQLTTTSTSPSKLIGCTINYNQREGLLIQGRAALRAASGTWYMGAGSRRTDLAPTTPTATSDAPTRQAHPSWATTSAITVAAQRPNTCWKPLAQPATTSGLATAGTKAPRPTGPRSATTRPTCAPGLRVLPSRAPATSDRAPMT